MRMSWSSMREPRLEWALHLIRFIHENPRSQHELSHGKAIAIATRWNNRRFADYYAHPQYPLQIFQLGRNNPARVFQVGNTLLELRCWVLPG